MKAMTKADIQKLALALPEADQIELAHTLLDNTTPSLTEPQEMEVTRRIKAYRADPSILVFRRRCPDQVETTRDRMRLFYTEEALDERGRRFPLVSGTERRPRPFLSLPILSIWSITSSISLLSRRSMLMASAVH